MTIKHPTPDDIPALKRLWKQAFRDTDRLINNFFAIAYAPERCLCVYDEKKPVAMLYWLDHTWREHKVAYVYAVATDRAYRGQGLCTKLLNRTATCLKKLGYYGIMLVPENPELTEFYKKRGYQVATTLCHFNVPAAGEPDPELRRITWEQYAFYRSQLLPEESLLPGEEVYRFLDTYRGFYRCAAGIFCAAIEVSGEERILLMQEFLGEPKGMFTAITGMGCQKAKVRLRGGAPFGLFRCLTRAKEMPAYIGLPMD